MKDPIERADALAAIALGDTVNQLQAKILAIPSSATPADKLAKLVEALTSLPAVYAHQINTGVREVYDPLQRFYTMESVLTAITEATRRNRSCNQSEGGSEHDI